MDCQYLREKYSIVKNLPRPAIEIDNHSHCSVKQCIADFLGKGYLPPSQLPDNAKQSKYITTRAKLLYGNDLENVLIMTGITHVCSPDSTEIFYLCNHNIFIVLYPSTLFSETIQSIVLRVLPSRVS